MSQLEPIVAQQPWYNLVDLQQGQVPANAQVAATAKL